MTCPPFLAHFVSNFLDMRSLTPKLVQQKIELFGFLDSPQTASAPGFQACGEGLALKKCCTCH
jgi:hypothetical protein